MKDTPYHHLADGTFKNPEGSPERDPNIKWSMSKWNKEKKKIKINIPPDHIISKEEVLKNLKGLDGDDYVAWIGHATFLIKLGNTTIITDPLFSKNAGPLIFGPKRYVDPAIDLKDIPEVNLYLLTHNHYDHLDYRTIKKFPYKKTKVLTPLKLGKYFTKNGFDNVEEMDWYDQVQINDLKVTLMPAVHWSKRQDVNIIIVGGKDAWRTTNLLRKNKVPVIYESVTALPNRRYEDYDQAYKGPALLHEAGVQFCIASSGSAGGAYRVRNLPNQAAMAAAYGLPKDEALRSITLSAAEILGIDKQVGSLESGKDATLFISNGDALEIRTNVLQAYIQGRKVDMGDRHKMLFHKYQEKYRQLDILK